MASRDKLEEFLAEPRNVIVAGIRKDGRPHVTPNWFLWDGKRFYVSTTRTRAKFKIFSRDPRVELVRRTIIVKLVTKEGALKRCSFLPAFIGTNSVPEVLEADDPRFTNVVNYLREMVLRRILTPSRPPMAPKWRSSAELRRHLDV